MHTSQPLFALSALARPMSLRLTRKRARLQEAALAPVVARVVEPGLIPLRIRLKACPGRQEVDQKFMWRMDDERMTVRDCARRLAYEWSSDASSLSAFADDIAAAMRAQIGAHRKRLRLDALRRAKLARQQGDGVTGVEAANGTEEPSDAGDGEQATTTASAAEDPNEGPLKRPKDEASTAPVQPTPGNEGLPRQPDFRRIRLHVRARDEELLDTFVWDVNNERSNPEAFVRMRVADLGLNREWEVAMEHALRSRLADVDGSGELSSVPPEQVPSTPVYATRRRSVYAESDDLDDGAEHDDDDDGEGGTTYGGMEAGSDGPDVVRITYERRDSAIRDPYQWPIWTPYLTPAPRDHQPAPGHPSY